MFIEMYAISQHICYSYMKVAFRSLKNLYGQGKDLGSVGIPEHNSFSSILA